MNYSIKVVFIKQYPSDKLGTLYLRVLKHRMQKRKTLGIKISQAQWKRYFDTSVNRFRINISYPQHENNNKLIELEIEKLKSQLHLPDLVEERPDSLINFWERQMRLIENHGTRGKQQVVLNKLKKFVKHKNLDDILFAKITSELIEEIQLYLRSAKDPRSLSSNTQNQYLKMIKSVIKKAVKKRVYSYSHDPFEVISYNKTQTKEKIVLDREELLRIARLKVKDQNLQIARNIFLFQVFSNGMRIGDVIRLQWKNVLQNSIKYEMTKNKKELEYPINVNLSKILLKNLKKDKLITDIINNHEIAIHDKYGFKEFLQNSQNKKIRTQKHTIEHTQDGYFQIKHYIWHIFVFHKVSTCMNKFYSELGLFDGGIKEQATATDLINNGQTINYHGFQIIPNQKELIEIINLLNLFRTRAQKRLQEVVLEEADKQNKNEFLFNVLNHNDYKALTNWQEISENQYKQIKNKTIVINRHLKIIQDECKISKTLTTHVARHTFSNLLLQMDNVNTSDLSATLGHSSLAITDKYVKSGFNKNKYDELNNRLSDEIRI